MWDFGNVDKQNWPGLTEFGPPVGQAETDSVSSMSALLVTAVS